MSSIRRIRSLDNTWQTLDPFIFSVHHLDHFPAGNDRMRPSTGTAGRTIGQDFSGKDGWSMYHGQAIPGFPYHPHRGFETITVVEQGVADHSDSLGSTGRFGQGDVQWMTAGKGVQHSEMFPLIHQDKPNTLELFQIWLNLPKKSKMANADYQMMWGEDIPIVTTHDSNGHKTTVKVIAGQYQRHVALAPPLNSWAADPDNHLAIWLIRMDPNTDWVLPKAVAELNRSIYMYQGDTLEVDRQTVRNYHAIDLVSDVDVRISSGEEKVSMLLLQGRPINEKVVQYGPFVMNSEEEIEQAYQEYRRTQFGGWPWPTREHVHPADKGRFALYPDGTIEERG